MVSASKRQLLEYFLVLGFLGNQVNLRGVVECDGHKIDDQGFGTNRTQCMARVCIKKIIFAFSRKYLTKFFDSFYLCYLETNFFYFYVVLERTVPVLT